MVIKIIIIFIILCASYYVYLYYKKDNIKNKKILIHNKTQFVETYKRVINRNEIFKPNINFTLSWDMKILNIPSNFNWKSSIRNNKPIVLNGGCPNIYYNAYNNQLIITFQFLDTHSMTIPKTIVLDNIPVQSWVNYSIIVKGRHVMIYMNNHLEKSYLLENIPIKQEGGLVFGAINNNFLGFINNFTYYNYPLKMNEIESIIS